MFLGLPFVLILGFLCLDEFPKTHQLVGIALILTSAVFSYFAVGKLFKSSKGVSILVSIGDVRYSACRKKLVFNLKASQSIST